MIRMKCDMCGKGFSCGMGVDGVVIIRFNPEQKHNKAEFELCDECASNVFNFIKEETKKTSYKSLYK